MGIAELKENWITAVTEVKIGATLSEGGTRAKTVQIGGQKALPFLFKEGEFGYPAKIAFEIWDIPVLDWPQNFTDAYPELLEDPLSWIDRCVSEFNAELICIKLAGAHPDLGDKGLKEEIAFLEKVKKKTTLPLILVGCGQEAKDREILPACFKTLKNERCLVGAATQQNYREIAQSALEYGHNLIAESPIDVNIAKQLNILISETGFPLERIVINPTVGALGYGLEYAYSIMERARLAALSGDKTLANPFVCFVGQEAWKAKEAKVSLQQGIIWELLTAVSFLQAGADLLVLRHPEAASRLNQYIEELCGNYQKQKRI